MAESTASRTAGSMPVDDVQPRACTRTWGKLGVGLLALTLVAVLSGVALLPFYEATADGAHASVAAFEKSNGLRFLWGIHHWSSALLILLGTAYLFYGLWLGAYRRPMQLAWGAAVVIVLLYLGFQLTGHALPWDRHAVSSTVMEAAIAADVPLFGAAQARLIRGGTDAVTARTLHDWYIAHVVLLPVALFGLALTYLFQIRRAGLRWEVPRGGLIAAVLALIVMAVALAPPLGAAAGPEDYQSFTAPPEWYVLAMHGLLSFVQRNLSSRAGWLATMVIPGLLVLGLLALPWLDRRTINERVSRPVLGMTLLGAVLLVLLTVVNLHKMAPLVDPGDEAERPVVVETPVPQVQLDPALVSQGKEVYTRTGCMGCHAIGGQGGTAGPPLDGTGSKHPDLDWHAKHIKEPGSLVPGSTMPPYPQLSETDLKALAQYMASLKATAQGSARSDGAVE